MAWLELPLILIASLPALISVLEVSELASNKAPCQIISIAESLTAFVVSITIFPLEYKRPSPVPIDAVFPRRMAFARADVLSILILLLFK